MRLVELEILSGTKGPQRAILTLSVDGEERTSVMRGNGPVDALFKAIRELVPHGEAELERFDVHAVTEGTDAQASVSVKLAENGRTVTGRGADVDTLVATARAYIHALNKLSVKRGRLPVEAVA